MTRDFNERFGQHGHGRESCSPVLGQARSAPFVEAFSDWLKQQRARVSPKSRLGEKLAYPDCTHAQKAVGTARSSGAVQELTSRSSSAMRRIIISGSRSENGR